MLGINYKGIRGIGNGVDDKGGSEGGDRGDREDY